MLKRIDFICMLVLFAATMVAANPVFAKNHKKVSIGCVPSPNPDVPPCDLDQTPLMPSDIIKNQAAEGAEKSNNDVMDNAKQKPSRQHIKETGY